MLDFSKLYSEICKIPMTEYFEKAENTASINPCRFVFNRDFDRILELCYGEKSIDYKALSDYERFAHLCASSEDIRGSGALELFRFTLEKFFDFDGEINAGASAPLWQEMTDKLCAENSYELICEKDGVGYANSVSPRIRFDSSYEKECAHILSLLAKGTRLFFDVSELDFCRADKYHCVNSYEKVYNSRFEKKDVDTVISGVLYSASKEAKACGQEIWLYIGDNYSAAVSIINYFSELSVLPDMRIFPSASISLRVAMELCRVIGDAHIKYGFCYEGAVSSEVISKIVKEVAGVYPIGECVFAGARTSHPLRSPYHTVFRRGLAKALCELYDDYPSALCAAEKILNKK